MKCPICQTDNSGKAKFCRKCGISLHTEKVCTNCKFTNAPDSEFCEQCGQPLTSIQTPPTAPTPPVTHPTSFANSRYQVKKFLGEGGKKKVYLAHDILLDRDIAFYLIKTEKLDEAGRTWIKREAQAMGKLGDHPHIITIFDYGEHESQPYMVAPLMSEWGC